MMSRDFMSAHMAKWVRDSARVRAPLPILSMSASPWLWRFVEWKKEFSLRMEVMLGQDTVIVSA